MNLIHTKGFAGGSHSKEPTCNVGDLGSIPGLGRYPWRMAWQPTPAFLPGEAPWTRRAWRATVHGVTKSRTRLCG